MAARGVVGPPDGTAPHVLVGDVAAPRLDDAAFHHLARVRRLRSGDRCTVTDGNGRWRWCRFTGDVDLDPDGEIAQVERHRPELTVAFALTKGTKPEWTVQKLTELGIDRIVPFRAERSIVRWDASRAEHQRARLSAVARGALEQSHGCWLPAVEPVGDLDTLRAQGAARLDRGGRPLGVADTVVAVGPEGGWTDDERAVLSVSISLGDLVLRAETAALTAGAMLAAFRSGIARPVGGEP